MFEMATNKALHKVKSYSNFNLASS